MRFLPDARLLRMRRKDWRNDFLSDFTRDRGPSMARESLGCRVHLGTQAGHQGSRGAAAEGRPPPAGPCEASSAPTAPREPRGGLAHTHLASTGLLRR